MTYETVATPGEGAAAMNVNSNTFDSQNHRENQVSTLAAMKAARRWMLAHLVWKPEKAKFDKVPHYADGAKRFGKLDTFEDHARLVSYDEAEAAARARGDGWIPGVATGPVGDGTNLQCVDFDDVAETGVGHLVDRAPGLVVKSQSGKGYHAYGFGPDFKTCASDDSGTEAYAHGHFMAFTANVVHDAPVTNLAPFVASEIVPYREARKASIRKVTTKLPAPTTPFETNDETLADIFSALSYFDPDNRHEWMEVIHAGNTYGEAAREPVRRWSAESAKHSDGEFNAKWDEVQPQHTSYRWIFAEASRRGWANPRTSGNWWNGNTVPEASLAANMAFIERAFGGFEGAAPAGISKTPIGNEGFEGASHGGMAGNSWPAPTPLPSNLPSVMRFDPAYLPDALAGHVMDIAERMQCPADFPAVATIVAAGAVIGTRLAIRPKPNDPWLVTPNLMGMIVGRPGTMKSPAVNEALAPLKRFESLARQDNERARSQYQRDVREYSIRLKAAEAKFKAAKNPEASLNLPDPPVEPKPKRLIVGDTTYEKLSMIAADNPNGVLVNRDELASLLSSLGREENADARGFYLTGANGRDSYTVDRVGRGHQHIEPLCLSMLGSIQPGRLERFIRGAIKGGEADDGMVQRFGCAVWPDQSKDWKAIDRSPNGAALTSAIVAFDNLHSFVVHQSNAH